MDHKGHLLSTKVAKTQPQALLASQSERSQLKADKASFEARAVPCAGYSKNSAVPPTDQPSCDKACEVAEGFPGEKNQFRTIAAGVSCQCVKNKDENCRTSCEKEYRSLCSDDPNSARTMAPTLGLFV